MNKKLQIFVSSTYTDLIEERQMVVQTILKFGGIPAGMELFTANSDEQFEIIKKWIDQSDIYLLILGGRYGSICEKTQLSYTEMEYDYAVRKKKPVISIILDDDYLQSKDENTQKSYEISLNSYTNFKEKVTKKMVSFVKSKEELSTILLSSINEIQNDENINLTGWVRADFVKIQEKYKIGEMSFNEVNKFLLSYKLVTEDKKIKSFINEIGNTYYDIYKLLIFCGGRLNSCSTDALSKYIWDNILPKLESVGLMQRKRPSGKNYYVSSFTRNGIKYNQLILKFENK